jgi:hypothetical protein
MSRGLAGDTLQHPLDPREGESPIKLLIYGQARASGDRSPVVVFSHRRWG